MKIWQVIFLTSGFLFILNCGRPINNEKETPTTIELSFGTESTFDIITWNLEWFPKSTQTVTRVAEILYALKPDIVGLQEIVDLNALNQIVDQLNQYDEANDWVAYFAGVTNSTGQELAFIVNIKSVSIIQTPFEIYQSDGMAFPRAPYVIQVQVNGKEWIIINNH